jgi:hypothetical protein
MEEVVAVELRLEGGETRYFMTWGRVQDPVDGSALEAIVMGQAPAFDLGGVPLRARLCGTLQEASRQPYFFEALLSFSRRRPAWTEAWRKSADRKMRKGKDLFYLGR